MTPKNLPPTYERLLSTAHIYTDAIIPSPQEVLHRFNLHAAYAHLLSSLLYIVDYTRLCYTELGPACDRFLGYKADYLRDAGPLFYTGQWHKNDFGIYNEKIAPEIFRFIQENKHIPPSSLLFSINYRVKNSRGEFLKFNQRSIFLEMTPSGTPLMALGMVTNIGAFKADNDIHFSIERVTGNNAFTENELLLQKSFITEEQHLLLTRREIEIIKWICDGFSSKQIADKLNNSIHTINNHRKHILQKTEAGNLSEVIAFAIRNHIV